MSGSLEGSQILLKDQLTIGYKKGDFLVKDPNIDSPHVQIFRINNEFSIQSSKDLKENILYNKTMVSSLVLQVGLCFQLGSTLFEVEETSQPSYLDTANLFSQKLEELSLSLEDELQSVDILKKAFQIKIERGTQKDEVWNIGYLPRKIGFTDSNLLLLDSHFTDVYFDLILEKDQVTFFTPYKDHILFNYKYLQKTPVKDKDMVIVGSSYLRFYI